MYRFDPVAEFVRLYLIDPALALAVEGFRLPNRL